MKPTLESIFLSTIVRQQKMTSKQPCPKHVGGQSNVRNLSIVALGVVLAVTALQLNDKPLEWFSSRQPLQVDDYSGRAMRILRETPLIDGHNDFPFVIRQQLRNQIYGHDFQTESLRSHSDFQKMKKGMMGGQFWSVFIPCPEELVPATNDLEIIKRAAQDLNEPSVCPGICL